MILFNLINILFQHGEGQSSIGIEPFFDSCGRACPDGGQSGRFPFVPVREPGTTLAGLLRSGCVLSSFSSHFWRCNNDHVDCVNYGAGILSRASGRELCLIVGSVTSVGEIVNLGLTEVFKIEMAAKACEAFSGSSSGADS